MTDSIELSPEEQRLCERTTQEWLDIALSTKPIDHAKVEALVPLAYRAAQLPPLPGYVCLRCLREYPDVEFAHVGAGPGVCDDRACRGPCYRSIQWVASPLAALELAAKLLGGAPATHVLAFVHGQHAADWLSFYDAWRRLGENMDALDGFMQIAREAHWWLAYEKLAIFSERPTIMAVDSDVRYHAEGGPALAYRDGYKLYAHHGVTIPEHVAMTPDAITWQQIDDEEDVEVRRVMMNFYTAARYIRDSGAALVHEDEWGQLYLKEVPNDEPVVMVRVVNSTPENVPPGTWHWEIGGRRVTDADELRHIARTYFYEGHADGYHWVCPHAATPVYKDYWLRVPPGISTAHDAVAWTCRKTAATYAPRVET